MDRSRRHQSSKFDVPHLDFSIKCPINRFIFWHVPSWLRHKFICHPRTCVLRTGCRCDPFHFTNVLLYKLRLSPGWSNCIHLFHLPFLHYSALYNSYFVSYIFLLRLKKVLTDLSVLDATVRNGILIKTLFPLGSTVYLGLKVATVLTVFVVFVIPDATLIFFLSFVFYLSFVRLFLVYILVHKGFASLKKRDPEVLSYCGRVSTSHGRWLDHLEETLAASVCAIRNASNVPVIRSLSKTRVWRRVGELLEISPSVYPLVLLQDGERASSFSLFSSVCLCIYQ